MKTKFFKKLSFVLVVAMVLSVFAPAASAFAAKKPALNSTKKYLHLGRVDNGQNEFNFNIKNKQKGSKYQWESSNEAIAVVNEKNGVTTAKGVGKATISVTITDKDGKDTTLKAQVIVRDNIETV
ncbi:MAG: Ig-like domain-containing protein, partial [Clostridiales bacterium]|nr:Ig-like domain-containing protein [Clostridiales bacterium]